MPYSSMTKNQLISEIQQLTQAVQEQKNQNETNAQHADGQLGLRLLLSTLPGAVLTETNERKVILANQLFCDLFGLPWSPSTIAGADGWQVDQKMKSLLADGKSFLQRIETLLANGKPVHNELVFLQDGRALERDFLPINGQGQIQIVWIYRDVSHRIQTEKALSDSEARYRNTLESMLEGCQIIGYDWKYLYVNDSVCRHARTAKEKLLGHSMMELYPGIETTSLFATLRSCMEKRQSKLMENEFNYPDGSKNIFQLSIQPVPEGIFILSMDITARKSAEHLLRKSEEHYRMLTENISDVIWILDLETRRFRYISPSVEQSRGYTVEEIMSQDVSAALTPASMELFNRLLPERLQELQQGRFKSHTDEVEQPCKDGHIVYTESTTRLVVNPDSGRLEVYGVSRDITERKQIEMERETAVEFLNLLNRSNSVDDLIPSVLNFVQQQSGCEAVGIRLRKGHDFPYFETNGFSKEFVIKENQLCLHDKHGQPVLDVCGNPVLECMCGNVINGRFDPTKPFFTQKGSFWTTCTSELLASTTEKDRQARTRNRCNGEGYESVALLALRAGSHILGLLQLNDKRKGLFTADSIARWERLADYLAVALAKLKSDEALRESEFRFRQLFESMSSGVAVYEAVNDGRDFILKDFNRAGETIEHIPRTHIIGKSIKEVFPGALKFGILDILYKVWKTGQPVPQTATFYSDGQRSGWRENYVYKLATDEIVAIYNDVTDRILAEQALRDNEEKLRLFIEHAPVALAMFDRDMCYLAASHRWLSDYHLGDQPILGHCHYEIFPEITERWKAVHRRSLAGEIIRSEEDYLVRMDGTVQWQRWEVRPWFCSEGAIGGIVIFVEDITKRKLAEEEKVRLEEQLHRAQKLETIGTLAGGIAHDFNNLLTPIMGYADMVLTGLSPTDPNHEDVTHILKAAARAKDLVEQILIFSREIEKEREPAFLHVIIEEALKLLRPVLPSNIEIQMDIDSTCDKVMADASQMHQVVINLCTNAFQAMEGNGGILTIALKQVQVDAGTAQGYPNLHEAEYVLFTVGDTGLGMDEKTKKRIFEPFFTTKEIGKGTGMGLSVVHGIVQSHHGEILVQSERGKGSVFQVYLPAIQSEHAGKEPLAVTPKGLESIMLVDDDEQVLKVLEKMLASLGYKVTALSNSLVALDTFIRQPESFDLGIFDLIMPNLTGLDLSKKIMAGHKPLPIIIMTGYGENISQEKKLQHGIRQVIVKPVTLNELASTIRIAIA